ncbi:MAG TPA: uracil-DNA glycosylase [Geobacterales bacterium]|nr:uracil-DNA glycosylase [Geobacterales bacterium]
MTGESEQEQLLSSLRLYLEDLVESGVEGLPRPLQPVVAEQMVPYHSVSSEQDIESLDRVRSELGECHRCQLGDKRTHLVFGNGNPEARVVFVGEAPGRDEDLQGEPFVGEAGQLLTRIIGAMGLKRSDVYICNVLKCRPPGNRNPEPLEIEACEPFLLRQIRAINPAVVIALGTFAAQTLLKSREPISRLRGKLHDYHGIPLMPTFHPAFLLRNPERKRDVWSDVQQVMGMLGL